MTKPQPAEPSIEDVVMAIRAAPLPVRLAIALDGAMLILEKRSASRRALGMSDEVTFGDVMCFAFTCADDAEVRAITRRCAEAFAKGEQPN